MIEKIKNINLSNNKQNYFWNLYYSLCILMSLICLFLLIKSKLFYLPFVIVFSIFIVFSIKNIKQHTIIHTHKCAVIIGSLIFSLIIIFGNYYLWIDPSKCLLATQIFQHKFDFLIMFCLLCCSFCCCYSFLVYIVENSNNLFFKYKQYTLNNSFYFFIPFIIFVVVYSFALFTMYWPGICTPDSFGQMGQVLNNNFSNHHPVYHTLIIKIIAGSVFALFGNADLAVCSYSIFSIICLSACFSFSIFTLKEIGLSRVWLLVITFLFAFLPYNIIYSFTMWKDVYFAIFVCLFCVCFYRVWNSVGKHLKINYCMLFISGVFVCLFRTNAIFAFIVLTILCFTLLNKNYKVIKKIILITLCVGIFLRFPLLALLHIPQPDDGEALSVPCQQIAKTYIKYKDLDQSQKDFVNSLIPLSQLESKYVPGFADYIKNPIRDSLAIKERNDGRIKVLYNFFDVYIKYGIKHPLTYFTAWVDQTNKFWNSGGRAYTYGITIDNDYISSTDLNATAPIDFYTEIFFKNPLLIFMSIGLVFWVYLLLLFIASIRKDKCGVLVVLLNILIMFTLFIATPSNGEFRYSYFLFCCLPFLFFTVFGIKKK